MNEKKTFHVGQSSNDRDSVTLREMEKYLEAGYKVLPLRPNDKRPACSNGASNATNDPQKARSLFENAPSGANLGLQCENFSGILKLILTSNRAPVGRSR